MYTLSEILFFSAGLTRRMKTGSGYLYMRAAPATGALYPIELYVVSADIAGLPAGVYHFNPLDFALVRLRKGDYRGELSAISSERVLASPVTIILTSLAWRNAWKYEARSYRHWFWDGGAIAANLLATSASEGLRSEIIMGFVDSDVNRLLGLEREKEATVAIAPVGIDLEHRSGATRMEVQELELEVEPLSREEMEYPVIWRMNGASALHSPTEVEEWRNRPRPRGRIDVREKGPAFPLQPLTDFSSIPSLEEVILRRGSTRRFARQPISFEQLSTIIASSSGSVPLDFLPEGEPLVDFYFIVNDVTGLPSGSYHFNRDAGSLDRLKTGALRNTSRYLCLEQPLFSDASAVFFLMTDLGRVLDAYGDRGYRAVQFEAGIRAGKIYLASYSLGIGASGSTFYDDAVTQFFSPSGADKSTMIAVGIGVPAYRAKRGSVLLQARAERGF